MVIPIIVNHIGVVRFLLASNIDCTTYVLSLIYIVNTILICFNNWLDLLYLYKLYSTKKMCGFRFFIVWFYSRPPHIGCLEYDLVFANFLHCLFCIPVVNDLFFFVSSFHITCIYKCRGGHVFFFIQWDLIKAWFPCPVFHCCFPILTKLCKILVLSLGCFKSIQSCM